MREWGPVRKWFWRIVMLWTAVGFPVAVYVPWVRTHEYVGMSIALPPMFIAIAGTLIEGIIIIRRNR